MRRRLACAGRLAAVGSALCLIAQGALAQGAGITITRRSAARAQIEPGAGLTAVFLLRNSGPRAQRIRTHMELPSGWRLVTPDAPILLSAHRTELRLLRLIAPDHASPGTYRLRYSAISAASGAVLARDSLVAIVTALRRLAMQPLDAPEMVVAGEPYRARFTVRNRGNVSTRVRLRVSSAYAWPARPDPDVITLAPGDVHSVSIAVQTDRAETRPRRHRLDVVAQALADTTATATTFSLVDVIPRAGSGAPRFHSLPLELTLRTTEPGDEISAELRGSGTLTEGGNDRIDLLLRGPDRGLGMFGEQDEYQLAITGNRYRLRLGDQHFALSPLTETGRTGFGGGGQLTLGRVTAGGFAQRDRRTYAFTRERQWGGFFETRVAGHSQIGVNYVDRLGIDAGRMWTARGVLAPSTSATLDVEYGSGSSAAGTGEARSVVLAGTHRIASYHASYLDADRNFPGLMRGIVYEDGELSFHPGRRFSLTGHVIDRTAPSLLIPGAAGDQHYRSVQGIMGYGPYLSAEYRRSWQDGNLVTSAYAAREETVRLRTGLATAAVTLFVGGELGRLQYGTDPERHPFQELFVQSSFRPGGYGSYSVALGRHHGSTLVSPLSQDWLSAQAYAAFQPWHGTRFRVGANVRQYEADMPSTYGVIDAAWEQDLLFGHRLTARARMISFGGTPSPEESLLQVGYTIPLGVPISASRQSARLIGRIVDARSGRPIAHALVRVGDRAQLSDESGRLVFSGLVPDTYYVHVDPHNLRGGEITLGPDPLPLRVGTLGTTHFELAMVRGARLTGTVRISAFASRSVVTGEDMLADSADMPNVIVSLTRDDGKVLRRVTDAQGRFSFLGLRPGRWTLSMPREALPEHYRLQRDSSVFDVAPGDTLRATLRVIPEHRALHIVATADLTVEGGATRAAGGAAAIPSLGGSHAAERHPQRPATATAPALVERPAMWHSYTVTRWDIGLTQIARYMYDDASLWPKIWMANRFQLPDPDAIRPGQTLLVPDKAPLTATEIAARDAYRRQRGRTGARRGIGVTWRSLTTSHSYTVTQWDIGLMQIARYMYGDASLWPKIWVANRFQLPDPDTIRPGQTLLIPDKAPLTPAEIAARDAYFELRR